MDLLDNLADMTDRFITNARVPSARPGAQEAMQRAQPMPVAWSAALRVSHEIIIQTTIACVVSVFLCFHTLIFSLELEEDVSNHFNGFRAILTCRGPVRLLAYSKE